jgi:hypothetical protein
MLCEIIDLECETKMRVARSSPAVKSRKRAHPHDSDRPIRFPLHPPRGDHAAVLRAVIELKGVAVHADFVSELYEFFFRFPFIPTRRKNYVSQPMQQLAVLR